MTIKEALQAVVQVTVPDQAIEKALIDLDLTAADAYASTNAKPVDLAAIQLLTLILSMPDISEGDYSIKYDRGAIAKRLTFLQEKYTVSASIPKVRALNVW